MKSRLFVISLCLCLALGCAQGRKISLRHSVKGGGNRKTALNDTSVTATGHITLPPDSAYIAEIARDIVMSGYDRNYGSSSETFLITNNSDEMIRGAEVEIVYYDMQGRMLHKRKEKAMADIPPSETRIMEIKAQKRMGSMYYYKSKAPRKGGIPYRVTVSVINLYL